MSEGNQLQRQDDAAEHSQQPQTGDRDGATDLSQVLNAVTAIMAESERRQSAALNDMQERIAEISSSAITAREDVPAEFQTAFERIENAMSHLAQRITNSSDPASRQESGQTNGDFADGDEETNATLQSLASLLGSDMNRPVPVAVTSATTSQHATTDIAGDPDEPWDEAMAEQLTQLYESGEAGLPPISSPPATAEPLGAVHQPSPAAATATTATAVESPSQSAERHWMADQFSMLASQIEQSLSRSGSAEISLETVAQRLAELESRFDQALEQLVTRSDVSSLRDIEACIVELTTQFEHSQAELARVQGIEWQVQALASRLTEERVSAMESAATSAQDQPDFAALAEAIGQQIAEQSNAIGAEAQSETVERTATELSDVKGLLNNLIAEQRSEGKETIDRLDAMQQAMATLLERIEHIETAELADPAPYAAAPQSHQSLQSAPHAEPTPGEPVLGHPSLDTGIAAAVGPELQPPPVPGSPAPAPHLEIEPELSAPAAKPEPFADDQRTPAPTAERAAPPPKADRQNFMAEARRAAAKANARADVQPGNDEDEEQVKPRKSPANKAKKDDGEGQTRSSRIRLLVAAVAVVAIGVSAANLLVGVPLLSFGGQSAPAKSAPASNPAPAPTQPAPAAPANPTTGSNQNGNKAIAPDAPRATVAAPTLSTEPRLAARPSPASLNPAPAAPAGPTNGAIGTSARLAKDLPPALIGPLSLRLAAANGNPSAMFEVGTRFAEGRGIQQDFKQAIKWYTRAATKSFALAQYRLAALYERGLGGKKDLARAKIWYERAARQGNVKSMHNLAVLTAGSQVGSSDYATAAQWFTQAAERGLTDSQFNLAILYENGLGVQKDLSKAYHWFGIAARSGDRDAAKRHQSLRAKIGEQSARTTDAAIANWRRQVTSRIANDARHAGSQWQRQQKTTKTNG